MILILSHVRCVSKHIQKQERASQYLYWVLEMPSNDLLECDGHYKAGVVLELVVEPVPCGKST